MGRARAVVLCAALMMGACARDGGGAEACAQPKELAAPVRLPADLPVTDELALTSVKEKRGFVSVGGFERTTVKSALARFHDAVTSLGFEIINTDYEGFEAEIFFARASASKGIVTLREGPCRGDVSVWVVYDPIDTKRGRTALDKSRAVARPAEGG